MIDRLKRTWSTDQSNLFLFLSPLDTSQRQRSSIKKHWRSSIRERPGIFRWPSFNLTVLLRTTAVYKKRSSLLTEPPSRDVERTLKKIIWLPRTGQWSERYHQKPPGHSTWSSRLRRWQDCGHSGPRTDSSYIVRWYTFNPKDKTFEPSHHISTHFITRFWRSTRHMKR